MCVGGGGGRLDVVCFIGNFFHAKFGPLFPPDKPYPQHPRTAQLTSDRFQTLVQFLQEVCQGSVCLRLCGMSEMRKPFTRDLGFFFVCLFVCSNPAPQDDREGRKMYNVRTCSRTCIFQPHVQCLNHTRHGHPTTFFSLPLFFKRIGEWR